MDCCPPVKLAFNSFEPKAGVAEDVPVIFLHGSTACKEYWKDIPQKVANATKRKAYAIDSRNHGDSEWTDVFNFDCNVVDILHFMDSINAPKAILVGHSMGGITAIKTALKCPERIEKLVVEDIGVRKPPTPLFEMVTGWISMLVQATEAMPAGMDKLSATKYITSFILEKLPPDAKNIVDLDDFPIFLSSVIKPTQDGRYTMKANTTVLIKAFNDPETLMTEPTGVYESPACFIYGKKSPFPVFQDADHIRGHFPKAEFLGFDATHGVHTERPHEFTETVLKFLLEE